MAEGREGDWECSGCKNRNYAFRSFCNRCKQPRLLVDTKTPPDSKWLPRIGDWICTGCTNNNYASREKCKKCGQPKEVAAMPAVAMPGVSLPTYSHYFARGQGGPEQNLTVGSVGNGAPPQLFPLGSNWSVAGPERYGVQSPSIWPMGGNYSTGVPPMNPTNQPSSVTKAWRNGDWICNCGFHNYSSRQQCKKCNAPVDQTDGKFVGIALGTKRPASEEIVQDWDNKRLNAGHIENHFQTNGQHQSYPGFGHMMGTSSDPRHGVYAQYPNVSSTMSANMNFPVPNLQVPIQFPSQAAAPTLIGKGAKQWRNGDWMCTHCNNHNYASRSQCNRCKTPRVSAPHPVSVV